MPYFAGQEEPIPANRGLIDGARTFASRQAYGASMGNPTSTTKGFMKATGTKDPTGRKSPRRHQRNGQGRGKRRKGG